MSSSEAPQTPKHVTLKIEGADPFTEIRVLDARFHPVALTSNTGSVAVNVNPGLYEVSFKGIEGWERHHVIARLEDNELPVTQNAPARSRAAAVEGLPESVQQPADNATVVVSLTGTPLGPTDPKVTMALIGPDNDAPVPADLVPGDSRNWRFIAAPGHWRLRLSEHDDERQFEIPLTVCPGYRVEIVAPLCLGGGMSVDLERMRVRLLPQDKPDAMDATLIGYEDAALAALSGGSALYGPAFERLIDQLAEKKRLNPMLGILAAHLCDRGQDDDLAFQERMLNTLAELTGGGAIGHPDVAALRLRLRMRTSRPIDGEPPVPFPPLLAASWAALLDAARVRPELIPAQSLSECIAASLWSSSLWVAWTAVRPEPAATAQSDSAVASATAKATTVVRTADEFAAVSESIVNMLGQPDLREWFRRANRASGLEALDLEDKLYITPAEAAVAHVLYPIAADEKRQAGFSRIAARSEGSSRRSATADLTSMAKVLGLPPTTVERAVGSLASKLEAQTSDFSTSSSEGI